MDCKRVINGGVALHGLSSGSTRLVVSPGTVKIVTLCKNDRTT